MVSLEWQERVIEETRPPSTWAIERPTLQVAREPVFDDIQTLRLSAATAQTCIKVELVKKRHRFYYYCRVVIGGLRRYYSGLR